MKSKLTKIWGVILVLSLMAGLLMMTVPASASTLSYSPLTTPNAGPSSQLVVGGDCSVFTQAADGKTMFVFDNIKHILYRSTNGGNSFSKTNMGMGLNALNNQSAGPDATTNVVSMAVSPNYASDSTLVAATTVSPVNQVFRSINGGGSFGTVGSTQLAILIVAPALITSVDYTQYYQGGDAILVSYADPALGGLNGGLALFTTTNLSWTNLATGGATGLNWPGATGGTSSTPSGGNPGDVLDAVFSPNHRSDAEIVALMVTPTVGAVFGTTQLVAKFGSENWGATVVTAVMGNTVTNALTDRPNYGTLAFPGDYDWSANNKIFLGLAGGTNANATNDVYVVSGGLVGGTSRFTDLNVSGANTTTEISSVALKGNYVGGKALVGQFGSNVVYRSTDMSASTPAWYYTTKNPSGVFSATDYVTVAWSPTSDNCYAITTNGTGGTPNRGSPSAFSVSTDGGINFSGQSLIDISAVSSTACQIYDLDFSSAPDAKTMYLIMFDDADNTSPNNPFAAAAPTAFDLSMLFKSADGGTSWQMVWWSRAAGTERFRYVAASPKYATDSTVYIAEQNSTRIWKSSNGGLSFVGLTNPAPINALYVVDGSTYYTGTINGVAPAPTRGFYKSGRWTSPTLSSTVNSIAIAPDNTIYYGTTSGGVNKSMDDGNSFVPVGGPADMGTGNNVFVAVDKDGKTLYAGSDGASGSNGGLYRWTSTSIVWELIDSGYTTTSGTTTVTFGADAINVAVNLALANALTITQTSGSVLVTASAGAPTILFTAPSTWTVTSTTAADAVLVTAAGTVTPCSGTILTGAGVTATLTTITDSNSNVVRPASIAPASTGSFLLPDLSGSSTVAGTTTGALLCSAVVAAPDGTLYTSNLSPGAGIRRSVNPTASSATLRGFESVLRDFSGPLYNGVLQTLDLVVGSNKLFAITTNIYAIGTTNPVSSSYGTTRVAAFDDVLAVAETLAAPRDTTVTEGTNVTLSWAKIDSPVTLTYQVETSTDSSFANLKDNTTTIGTSINFTGFVPGTTYWWRVRVYPGAPVPGAGEVDLDIASKWSVGWTFMPQLGMLSESGQVAGPTLQSPAYGDDKVILRPTFSWLAVPGADSYELQLATNPFFAMPTIKAPLSHTTWTWDEDLTYGTTYYWRVRAVKAGNIYSPWAESLFTIMTQPAPEKPPVVVTQAAPQPAPVINLPTPVVNIPAQPPPTPSPITPVVIWVIIIIGAILVIAVIVLIVRTRRVP